MQVFVDFVGPAGVYSAGSEPCTVDPALPIAVLTAPVFLSAVGQPSASARCRVFHLEAGRFLDEPSLGETAVRELDTLVVVNTAHGCAHTPDVLTTYWQVAGGDTRRDAHVGVPLRPGAAGQYAALAANSAR